MKIVFLSDTHLRKPIVSYGDVLCHSGDSLSGGSVNELEAFLSWFSNLPHPRKILIAGNHDRCFEHRAPVAQALCKEAGIIYLQDSGIEIDGVKFWGSPWQPEFYDWSFNLPRGPKLAEKWALIPEDTEVLLTHGPPYGILDLVPPPRRSAHMDPGSSRHFIMTRDPHVGCEELTKRLHYLPKLKIHSFGHIHHSYGRFEKDGAIYLNSAICNEAYSAVNAPHMVELDSSIILI